jgi:hypothetical protein
LVLEVKSGSNRSNVLVAYNTFSLPCCLLWFLLHPSGLSPFVSLYPSSVLRFFAVDQLQSLNALAATAVCPQKMCEVETFQNNKLAAIVAWVLLYVRLDVLNAVITVVTKRSLRTTVPAAAAAAVVPRMVRAAAIRTPPLAKQRRHARPPLLAAAAAAVERHHKQLQMEPFRKNNSLAAAVVELESVVPIVVTAIALAPAAAIK